MIPLTPDTRFYFNAIKLMGAQYYGLVYLFHNLNNGKCYVGQTTQEYRYSRYFTHLKNARLGNEHPFYRAIRKYGESAFTFEVIANCDDQQSLDEAERFFIGLYNTLSPNGYNFRGGGSQGKFSEDLKARLKVVHSSPEVSKKHSVAISKCWQDPDHLKKMQSTWAAKQPGIEAARFLREQEIAEKKFRERPEKLARKNANIKAAHSKPEVKERVGLGTRGGKWVYNLNQPKQTTRLKPGELVPNGWAYGRGNTYDK